MSRSIVVVGAGLAGLRAVEQLRGVGWTDASSSSAPRHTRPTTGRR